MKHFKAGNLTNWADYKGGWIEFAANKPRYVKFEVMANSPVEVWACDTKDMKGATLVAVGNDKMSVEYTADATSYVQLRAEKGSKVFTNIRDLDQKLEHSGEPSFVVVEPRVRESNDINRIMQYVKMNEEARDRQMAQERAQLRAEIQAEVAKTKPKEQVIEQAEDNGSEADT